MNINKISITAALILLAVSCAEASDRVLIAYFTRTGSTRTVADNIAANISADMFRIETVNPYPDDYSETTRQAQQEQNDNARPELSGRVSNMDQYNVIFLGYPIWWGTVPMAIHTFLESYDFSGKRVIPFNTHGGSGLGRSITDIKAALPDSDVGDGFAVRGTSAGESATAVSEWIAGLNIDVSTVSKSESTSSSGGCGVMRYWFTCILLATIVYLKPKYRKGLRQK